MHVVGCGGGGGAVAGTARFCRAGVVVWSVWFLRPLADVLPLSHAKCNHHLILRHGCSIAYWTLSYPLDIIKSAIQTDAVNPAERRYKGWAHAASSLWKEGGVKRYTAGIVPCLARSFPANAAGFVAYEAVLKAMRGAPKLE